ncbi:MAG TPA: nitrilase-related carbon-nitrogen hydrolase, partial [Methanomicrobiales archaeon]|nr:nitrilase-related carbon-nitrogen hydrolase [Methanomicrobiales archaeon]
MEDRTVRIGLVQTSVSDDLDENLRRSLRCVESVLEKGANIVCLPELYRSPYFPQFESRDASRYAETIPGESTEAFSALARQYHAVIIVPLFERAASGEYYNSAAVIDTDGSLLPVYHKVHIPHDPLFYEKHYFRPGEGYRIYDTKFGRLAVLICYDQWFPEAARAVTLMGAEIIFYPTAIGWICDEVPPEGDWREAWETVQRGHAIANGTPVAAVNRVGREGDLLFWGSSFVCDAFGTVIARAGGDEEILIADLDLAMNQRVREGWGFLRNRCPATYGALLREATPRRLGYHMPAEWERQEAIWLSWPQDSETFQDIEAVERSYIEIIRAVQTGERVDLLVADAAMRTRVESLLSAAGVPLGWIRMHTIDYADVWIRDYGPTFLVNREVGGLAMVD